MNIAAPPLLQVRDLTVQYGATRAVGGFTLDLHAGEVLCVVGESGSGKTQMLMSLLGLSQGRVSGSIRLEGEELAGASPARLAALRGSRLAMVFQDPLSALNPYLTVGTQLLEVLAVHRGERGAVARARALEMLAAVHIADPQRRLRQYPHELSGGMRQRVMIAMALLCGPRVLLADEPTTALDVTVQAQVIALLLEVRERFDTAILLVTHDLGVVAECADRVAVMRAGRLVEVAPVTQLFAEPQARYTAELLAAARALETP